MESMSIVHNDLKLANFLVTDRGVIVADLGQARDLDDGKTCCCPCCL